LKSGILAYFSANFNELFIKRQSKRSKQILIKINYGEREMAAIVLKRFLLRPINRLMKNFIALGALYFICLAITQTADFTVGRFCLIRRGNKPTPRG